MGFTFQNYDVVPIAIQEDSYKQYGLSDADIANLRAGKLDNGVAVIKLLRCVRDNKHRIPEDIRKHIMPEINDTLALFENVNPTILAAAMELHSQNAKHLRMTLN